MTDASQSGSDLELGKAAILEIVKEVSRGLKVDYNRFAFEWKLDPKRSQMLPLIRNGNKQHVLRIEEKDVAAWPASHEIAQKYTVRIIHIMEIVKRSQRREVGLDDETVETWR